MEIKEKILDMIKNYEEQELKYISSAFTENLKPKEKQDLLNKSLLAFGCVVSLKELLDYIEKNEDK